jgi:lipid-A-disaccharide synthase
MAMKILVSAGETSGDRYAAELVTELRRLLPDAEFFGSAGPHMREAGVEPIIRSESLAVLGLLEVVRHIPRIYGEFKTLIREVRRRQPDFAILTDSPDFHIRVAAKLKPMGVPVVWYVAPQFWAWRQWRVHKFRHLVNFLLCIFPFEEQFFRQHGVVTTYVGHPLADTLVSTTTREDLCSRYNLDRSLPIVALLPGSRRGESARHIPHVISAVEQIEAQKPANFVLAASNATGAAFFRERISVQNVRIVENDTQNLLRFADVALVASGTATVEAALQGAPMVVFYRVSWSTWLLGKPLVKTPYYSMVNLLANREIVPELIQSDCTGDRLAAAALRLLTQPNEQSRMKADLSELRQSLASAVPAATKAAEEICRRIESLAS